MIRETSSSFDTSLVSRHLPMEYREEEGIYGGMLDQTCRRVGGIRMFHVLDEKLLNGILDGLNLRS